MNSTVQLLDGAAKRFADRIAFADKDGEISFSELRDSALRVAGGIKKYVETGGIKPIIVYMEKSIKSIVCFMGIMYAGSPYVPIDYMIPLNRLEKTAENLHPAAIITDADGAKRLLEININAEVLIYDEIIENSGGDADIAAQCDLDPAYIMYTSGSTGTPKGVTVTHRGVIDYIQWAAEAFPIDGGDIIGMQSAFHFDNSVFDMFVPMVTGAKTVIIPEALFMYPEKLIDFLKQEKISIIFWVPTVMISAADAGIPYLPNMKLILFAGEVMPVKQLNVWRGANPQCMYVNMYGPTEATDIAAYYIVDREYEDYETLPIGRACANMRTIILNGENRKCKTGEQGELCLLGSGIAAGYWNAPELTEKAFVQNPLNTKYGEIIYRTGDLVYENDEGNIIFLGRRDSQIKLRGNRIELGDIESAATAAEGIRNACTVFCEDRQEIILFLETDEEIKERKFKLELKRFIPSYMVPAKIKTMKSFPHTPSGKIDRVSLKKGL
ncbi:MAG: amino acid adenylation domain-containing protein [Oscillospiraceae bacterium]|nr:amino acid adenylation domain-containing protein [Oscillospiraceae bacterium]